MVSSILSNEDAEFKGYKVFRSRAGRGFNYPELHRLDQRGVNFVTIRRRGESVVRRLLRLPASAWTKAVIDTPKRFHQQVRYVDERVRLPGYGGRIRQVAIDGLGNERP